MSNTKKVTVHSIAAMTGKTGTSSPNPKKPPQKIAMVTAYDASFARLLDEGGCDILLVGDSLGMVVKGETTTLSVTVDEMHLSPARRRPRHAPRAAGRRHAVHVVPELARRGGCATPASW